MFVNGCSCICRDTRNDGNRAGPWHHTPGTSYTDREYHPSIPLWSFVCDSLHVQMLIVIHSGLVSLAVQTSLAWAVHQDIDGVERFKHAVNVSTKAPRFWGEYIPGKLK